MNGKELAKEIRGNLKIEVTELKKQGIKSEKEVYGATLSNNSLKIVKFKNQKVENKNEKWYNNSKGKVENVFKNWY